MKMRLAALLALAFVGVADIAGASAAVPDSSIAAPFGSPVDDEHVFVHGLLDQFEGRLGGDDNALRWDGQAWAGTDANRLWLKSEGSIAGGRFDEGSDEVLYDRPISTYFDLQGGVRYDFDSDSGRGWAAIGIQGLAPQFFEVEATAYASDAGHLAARLKVSYDMLITQRLVLQPELETNFYSKEDPQRRLGSGFTDLDAGLRLRYEIRRKIAPYLGVSYSRLFTRTAAYARAQDDPVESVRLLLGIRLWF